MIVVTVVLGLLIALFIWFGVEIKRAPLLEDRPAIWICDVAGCLNEVKHCDVGECGDLWLCDDHWCAVTGDDAA